MKVLVPLRTVTGMNAREHVMARARRVKSEKAVVAWSLVGVPKPALPCVVTLTRVGPRQCDDDNNVGALKACRDAVATWLGVDDRHAEIARYEYAQERGQWAVEVEFSPMEVPHD